MPLINQHSIPTPTSVQRQILRATSNEIVKQALLDTEKQIPLVITPAAVEISLYEWVTANRLHVQELLDIHGGILFRGFGLSFQEDFERFLDAIELRRMHYSEGATPRSELRNQIYTSTEFPAEHPIALHNELSYVKSWPTRIAFFCVTPASEGGNTPIADVRQVLRRISAQSLDQFLRLNWKLVRNYDQNFGLSWQQAFRTTSKNDVEEYCQTADIKFEWRNGQHLRTSQVRPASAIHPRTKEATWFNHAAFWNVSTLPLETKRMFLKEFTEDGLPYNTYFGDGTPIPEHVIREISDAYDAETVQFQWQKGDLLLLDNMLAAHGRGSYKGNRKIIVSMGDPYKRP